MAKVKADIRLKAGQRRDRKYLEMLDKESRDTARSHDGTPDQDHPHTRDVTMSGASSAEPEDVPTGSHVEQSTPASTWSNASIPLRPPQTAAFFHDDSSDIDLHYIMIFLDSIFPYLFPYYHPFVLTGGRGWVLQSLLANRSVYHTCISLSSYFFSILLGGTHTACTNAMVERLQIQLEMGLRELRTEMANLRTKPPALGNVDALTCMQSIVLMCHFEVATSNKDTWIIHLDAATTLLQQLVPSPDNWSCVLEGFDSGQFDAIGLEKPFTSHQSALRFYAAQCLYMDVLSSITLSRVPRLHNYQGYLMPGCAQKPPNKMRTTELFLDEFIGIHNGTLQVLSDVAALDAWKKEQRKAGSLSIHELLAKAKTVGDAIKVMVDGLESVVAGGYDVAAAQFKPHFEVLKELQVQTPDDLPGHPTHNLIWVLASQTYLHLVTSGWQPSCPEIARNVARMTELFASLPTATALRSLALPLCLAGCLAGPEQECTYRAFVENMGSVRVFGTVKDALAVMEAVWARRASIDESWDLSKCLNILGHGVLLS